MIRLVANGKDLEFDPTTPNDWTLTPCWRQGCTLYWRDDPERMTVRLQHGDNAEASRVFAATPSRFGGLTVSQPELLAWLQQVHAYEDRRRETRGGG